MECNAVCQGIFRSFWLGCNSIQIISCVYLYGVHVRPVVMCVCPQFRIAATKWKKVKFCFVVWHGTVTVLKTVTDMRHAVAVIDKICNCCMYLYLYGYVCLFADCEGQSIETHRRCHWSWDTSSCRCWSYGNASVRMRTQRGAESMPVVSENWHAWQGNKMGAVSSWQHYGQIWGAWEFFALTTIIKQ